MSTMTEELLVLEKISSDWNNTGHSWVYTSVHTFADHQFGKKAERGSVRVEIRADAYDFQSYAKISVWSATEGWLFHTSIPPAQWYERAPSYTRKKERWEDSHSEVFFDLESELLGRFAATFFPGATLSRQ